jgi:hypothetical protein
MERDLRRTIGDKGDIRFTEAPAGWLTRDGSVRAAPWRAYYWLPSDRDVPVRLPSVSTILDAIMPKPGLTHWAAKQGSVAAMEAAKTDAAKRGLDVHSINEHYMLTGEPPKLSEHPAEHHGYIRSWVKAILVLEPEPVEVEQLVVHGDDGYAGRLDMRAIIRGALELNEYKTQENGALYAGIHWQAALYERAEVWCGGEPADRLRGIVLPADGDWNEEQHTVRVELHDWQVDAALAWWRAKRPVESACASRNRAARG